MTPPKGSILPIPDAQAAALCQGRAFSRAKRKSGAQRLPWFGHASRASSWHADATEPPPSRPNNMSEPAPRASDYLACAMRPPKASMGLEYDSESPERGSYQGPTSVGPYKKWREAPSLLPQSALGVPIAPAVVALRFKKSARSALPGSVAAACRSPARARPSPRRSALTT